VGAEQPRSPVLPRRGRCRVVETRDDFLRDALGIRKLYFEFEKGVFAATHQAH